MIWKFRNEAVFKGKTPSLQHALICIRNCILEANDLENGCMKNSISDLLILHRYGIKGRVPKAPLIVEVQWIPPDLGWIKMNTDGAANGSPGMATELMGVMSAIEMRSCTIGTNFGLKATPPTLLNCH
ncbi:hypothetical protein TIFTF001_027822 [Ficus carica]|uniref:RNase H type-1 domain-containing protein n=1 Tax=Ficus carica TaxID=3494 RepID=A0AA88IZ60_FICCA|nr:hypothetical protein TIFTF001_027822 [Ficus carica]